MGACSAASKAFEAALKDDYKCLFGLTRTCLVKSLRLLSRGFSVASTSQTTCATRDAASSFVLSREYLLKPLEKVY